MKAVIKRRPLGKTGLHVSEVGLGAMNVRRLDTKEQAIELVSYALECGINLIDTARGYSGVNGSGETVESEQIVGEAVKRASLDEPVVIITKGHGYTPDEFDAHIDKSLSMLGVTKEKDGLFIGKNRIYLVYFLHGIKSDRWAQVVSQNTLAHAKKRKEAGDFSFLGFSSHYGDRAEIKAAIDTGAFSVIELPYNIYNRSLGEDGETDIIKYAYDKGIGVVNMKAFNGNGMMSAAGLIKEVCDISYADMLRFCLSRPYISTVDAGARFPEELDYDIEAAALPEMDFQTRERLKSLASGVSKHLNSICRECMHCLEKFECPQGINFPDILGLHARYRLAGAMGKNQAEFKAAYLKLSGPLADKCAACGACSPWCEYHLDIPELMAQVREDF